MISDPRAREKVEVGVAFEAMRNFLHAYWKRGAAPDALEVLLGSLSPAGNRKPLDPAQWQDFLNAIEDAKRGNFVE